MVRGALTGAGFDPQPLWSFDFLSLDDRPAGTRFIEVKGRGTSGPIQDLVDREYDTAARLGTAAWLYVVFGCSTDNQQLYIINDWARLPWSRSREPDPSRLQDSSFSTWIPDKRSPSKRKLDAEGTRTLESKVVLAEFQHVIGFN